MDNSQPHVLLQTARKAIYKKLNGQILLLDINEYDPAFRQPGASFVTLKINHQLRGCVGSLEPYRSLVEDVARNAEAAAFEDSRFPPLTPAEWGDLQISISILNSPEPMSFQSEEDLIRQLRPRVDGLVLQENFHCGTFLPSVWQQLPEPREFLRQLKRKAGLDPDYWSSAIQVQRYTTSTIADETV
ncbi:MAG TPA: AmmeMemoRadiSam system protein A [Acidiferrobacteraceae bacterium]|nr:AmmeMemoRadiSam system protein A [Acidiferrobacteraceae bacterium]HEX20163.1 AmmeMemoRadiSam system protein A [Acidiferrobacteraceae bacterium]